MTGYDCLHLVLDCLQKHDDENESGKEENESNPIKMNTDTEAFDDVADTVISRLPTRFTTFAKKSDSLGIAFLYPGDIACFSILGIALVEQ